MERYDRYKDSGIKWIGEIPKSWRIVRAKSIFTQRKSKGNTDLTQLSATQDKGMVPQSLLASVVQVSEEADLSQFKTVHKGDFVISLRSFQGGFELSQYEGVCSPAYQVFFGDQLVSTSYFKYLFKCDGFISKMNSLTVGIREGKNIQYQDFANSLIVLPSKLEQKNIADYLDRQTLIIDSLVQKTKKSIELLQEQRKSVISEAVTKGLDLNVPMKDSGIEWIGEIPEGWSISSLKYLASIKGGSTPSKSNPAFWGGEIPWVSSQEVKLYRLTDTSQHITQEALDYCSNVVYPAETVVMVVRSGILKHTLPVSILDKPMTINQDIKAVQFFRDSQSAFFYYFVKGLNNALLHELCKDGSTVDNLDIDLLSRCPIIQPPIDEQTAIVDYLDQKTSEIDSLIEKKKQLVEKLQEYRKSLISECVTGKVKVPGVE